MPIAISDTHRELESVARSFLESAKARAEARALLDAPDEKLPAFWDDVVGLWLGLHLPESVGGSGIRPARVRGEWSRSSAARWLPGRSSRLCWRRQ